MQRDAAYLYLYMYLLESPGGFQDKPRHAVLATRDNFFIERQHKTRSQQLRSWLAEGLVGVDTWSVVHTLRLLHTPARM